MKVLACNCTAGCSSMQCGCRKNGVECLAACGDCQESGWDNSVRVLDDLDGDDCYDSL